MSVATRRLALRLDDVGASSKRYEVYSKRSLGIGPLRVSGNWLFLKYLPGWRAWGPYREMTAADWRAVLALLRETSAKLTVGVTAAWADSEDVITPFPERFPEQASVLRDGVRAGLIEIANHGLTHCVLAGNRFHPHAWHSNRVFHREFWDWVPADVQETHLQRSQRILQEYFGVEVITFVPPGNVFVPVTLEIAARHGLRFVSCAAPADPAAPVRVLGNENVVAFHDRDLVLHGIDWLRDVIARHDGVTWCTVAELGEW